MIFFLLTCTGTFTNVSESSAVLNKNSNHVVLNQLLQNLSRNLRTAVDDSDLDSKTKSNARADIADIFSPFGEGQSATLTIKYYELIEEIRSAVVGVIENLELDSNASNELHAGFHQVFSSLISEDGCYKSIAENHTGCLENKTCNFLASGVGESDKDFIVGFHNRVRAAVAQGWTNYNQTEFTVSDTYQPTASAMLEIVSQLYLKGLTLPKNIIKYILQLILFNNHSKFYQLEHIR